MSAGRYPWSRTAESAGRPAWWAPQAPLLGSLLLGLLAVLQALAQPSPRVEYTSTSGATPAFLVLIALATTLPLGLLWSGPRVSAVVIAAACLVSAALVHSFTLAGLAALLVALYRVGYRGPQLLAGILAVPFLGLALLEAASPLGGEQQQIAVVLAAVAPVVAWAGYARRARTESAAHSAETEAITGSLLEHMARGERARISRELHDVVAHHISMIAVQAETARLTTPGMPAAGAQRLLDIGDTARSALTEMRRLLGVLREDTTTGEPQRQPQRQPQPGLGLLNRLLDDARDATGSSVRLIVSGWMTVLDPGVELAAYRIVQEALTNARRHAPGAAVDVELRYEADSLSLRIRDNGPGPAQAAALSGIPAGGHGLLGMRERAAAVGGTLQTGAARGGGFLVEATLPVVAETDAA